MIALNDSSRVTAAFALQATIAFGVSFLGVLGGIFFLPIEGDMSPFFVGALVILVDHDMSLVQACCTTTRFRPIIKASTAAMMPVAPDTTKAIR